MINIKNEILHVYFGGVNSATEINSTNLKYNFRRINQIHSNLVVESSELITEADAHYASKPNEALLISTADCMPIMIYCKQTHRIAAVHAGWRGVVNKITEKTLKHLITSGSTNKDFQFWIGPHILKDSFDVDKDVYNQLRSAHYGLKDENFVVFRENKFFIDLNKIVENQIQHTLDKMSEINFYETDTKANANFCSYRRDQKTQKRNLSFICLLGE